MALAALFDPTADEDVRLDGALLLGSFIADVRALRLAYVKQK